MIYPFNAHEAVKIAIRIEENGLDFYNNAAKKFQPSKTADLFVRLAKEEEVHKAIFTKMLAELPKEEGPSVFDPDNEMDQYLQMMAGMHVFLQDQKDVDGILDKIKDEKAALELAISFEKDSVNFYVQLKEATQSVDDRIPVDRLISEESKHVRVLSAVYNKLFPKANA
ncbi:MAG: ferritin family protein [Deltaproteobacteria bacterium]|jgi:rubrerythrin|nr:ferritin family protein [Deltaproteobacteria bacterium]